MLRLERRANKVVCGFESRRGDHFALIVYRIVRLILNQESWVRFPVGAPFYAFVTEAVYVTISKIVFCGFESHLAHQFTR